MSVHFCYGWEDNSHKQDRSNLLFWFILINPLQFVAFSVKPPAYNDTFLINADTGVLEVKTAVDREGCPYLVVGIQVVIVLEFSVLILSLNFIK